MKIVIELISICLVSTDKNTPHYINTIIHEQELWVLDLVGSLKYTTLHHTLTKMKETAPNICSNLLVCFPSLPIKYCVHQMVVGLLFHLRNFVTI